MRAFLGTRLFRIAGHPVYGGVSGHFAPGKIFLEHGSGQRPARWVMWFGIGFWATVLWLCLR